MGRPVITLSLHPTGQDQHIEETQKERHGKSELDKGIQPGKNAVIGGDP